MQSEIYNNPPPPPTAHHQDDEVLTLITQSTPNPALKFVALSIASFLLSKSLLRQLAPKEARSQGPGTVWKWVNTANSMVHSVVTGGGAVVCAYSQYPRITTNVISTYSDYSHRLVCYSVGYFLFDILDMIVNHRKRSSYELIVHHCFVLSCFTLSITTRYYLAFSIISLLVEVNSIFLHYRQLLLITHTPKSSPHYRLVSGLNLGTFAVFRICVLGWMSRWMVMNKALVDPGPYWVGVVSIVVLMVMSGVLFFRLVRVDLFQGYNKKRVVIDKVCNSNGVMRKEEKVVNEKVVKNGMSHHPNGFVMNNNGEVVVNNVSKKAQ